jgi:kynurenine 3-monooxygenase
VVRGVLQKREHQDYSQQFLAHGYKELFIPSRPDGSTALERNAMHIWPRGRFMMMAMTNLDASFTVTLYLPMTGPNGFDRLETPADVRAFFDREFPDAVPLMPTLVEDFFANKTGAMVTVRTYPWAIEDHAALIGDAAHAIVPFYGQGANAGFEDCLEFVDQVRQSPDDLKAAFERYQTARKPNTEAIADLALANFAEMRDHVASPAFRLKKRFEQWLHALVPGFIPLYPMISFSLIPYAEARARAERQNRIVRRVGWSLAVGAMAAVAWLALR